MPTLSRTPGRWMQGLTVACCMTFLAAACATEQPASNREQAVGTAGQSVLETREGEASYTARVLDGRETASGTTFDNEALVAAHPTYPFGTVARVTNTANARNVEVRIVDRGPAAGPRRDGVIIDLSRAAAESLGFVKEGRAKVRVEVLRWGRDNP